METFPSGVEEPISLSEEELERQNSHATTIESAVSAPESGLFVYPAPTSERQNENGIVYVEFSPAQMDEMRRHANTYDGLEYHTGDQVRVNGHPYVIKTIPSLNRPLVETVTDYASDPSGHREIQKVIHARMLLESADPNVPGEWWVTEGMEAVKKAGPAQ